MRSIVHALSVGACLAISGCPDPSDDTGTPGTTTTATDDTTGDPTTGAPEDPFLPAPGGLRRLLRHQYVGSIRYLLGDAAAAAAVPPEDYALHGFDAIGAAELALQSTAIEQLETSARAIAVAALSDRARLGSFVPCVLEPAATDVCYQSVAADFGRLAWRRPLAAEEIAGLAEIAVQARHWAGDDFATGLQYQLMALLQAPDFLYIVEVGEPGDEPAARALTPTELAARMSFFLLGRTPDRELLDAAAGGRLESPEQVRAAAVAMLARAEARATLSTFYSELLMLRDLPGVMKSAELFPQFTPELAEAMQQETLRLIDDIVWRKDDDFRALFDADYTLVDPTLANFYGLPAPAQPGFQAVPLAPEQGRAGLLGHAGLLARFAHPSQTSPTRRGLFVRTKLLCEGVAPPPPGVDTSLPPPDPDMPQTMKQKLVQHMEDPNCNSCHSTIDPIGFALEHYDAVGAFRSTDLGLPIDATGSVADLGAFDGARELAALLAADERTAACVIKNFVRGALGHIETLGERPAFADLEAAFEGGGYRLQHLLVELTASPLFRSVGAPK